MGLRLKACLNCALCLGIAAFCRAGGQPDVPPPAPAEESQTQPGVEVQTRGPVHEAYAEPPDARPEPSPLVTKEPPPPVEEVPPDQRPEGDEDVWIPGYWAYDDEAASFVWVSGAWRVPPPGRQWVPGSWQEVEGGWHWIPGYWGDAGQEEAEYLPAPPPSLDAGPTSPPPDESSDYVTGSWVYREGRFRWRPGFWLAHRNGWCWTAPHYVWCTLGYIFVDGYWDRPLLGRGLLFAPVRLDANVVAAQGFQYVPRFAVLPDFLVGCLFARPATCHYYFGDYFEDRYAKGGFVPWVDFRVGRAALDPNFAYYRGEFAREPRWEHELRALYSDRRNGAVPRPPRTLTQQTTLLRGLAGNRSESQFVSKEVNITRLENVTAVVPLRRLNNVRITGLERLALEPGSERRGEARRAPTEVVKLAQVTREQRARDERSVAAVRDLAKQRAEGEARLLRDAAAGKAPPAATRTLRIERPKDVPWLNVPGPKAAPTPPERRPEAVPERRPEAKPAERARPVEPAPARPNPPPAPAKSAEPPRPQPAPTHVVAPRQPPPPPALPKHEDRPIPPHQPPPAPKPPPPKPAPPPAKEPPHKEEPKKK
jgi:hypothetical protein